MGFLGDKNEDQPIAPQKPTWFSKVKTFLTHRTVWRIVAIGAAVAATVLSGGAAIPAMMLGLTFLGSLVGVIGKVHQLRIFERHKLQHKVVSVINDKKQQLENLRKTHGKILDVVAPQKPKPDKVHQMHVPPQGPKRSFMRVLRDVGLENALSFVTFGLSSNIVGLGAYIFGVVGAIKNIKGEFQDRVKLDIEQQSTKFEINEKCQEAGIPPYNNTKELHQYFQEEMISNEAQKRLCEAIPNDTTLTDVQIKAKYKEIEEEVRKTIIFDKVPESVPFTKKLWDALKPWNQKPIDRFEDITTETAVSYKTPEGSKKQRTSENLRPDAPTQQASKRMVRGGPTAL